jgi:malonate decarboxylase gamma subunit
MSELTAIDGAASARGRIWLEGLAGKSAIGANSVLTADGTLAGESVRYFTVGPDPKARFPRARRGEIGLAEGWGLAALLRATLAEDANYPPRPIIAIVDSPGQAYGQREERLGLHLACAAAVNAYAAARMGGHPVIALVVGRAMSGGFLAHGAQANRILALDDPGVMIHAMGKKSAARVTRRSVEALTELARHSLPMAYDVQAYAQLGLLHGLIGGVNAADPAESDFARVRSALVEAIADTRQGPSDLSSRWRSAGAQTTRRATREVRRRLAEQWDAPPATL